MIPGPAAGPHDLAGLEVAAKQAMGTAPVRFRNERGLRAVLDYLASIWPAQVPWESLTGRVPAGVDPASSGGPRGDDDLAWDLICCYRLKLVELRTPEPRFVARVTDRPVASRLARYQAEVGPSVANLRHEIGQLNEFSRFVLRQLDGTRDRAGILDELTRARDEGRLVLPPDSTPGPGVDAPIARQAAGEEVLGTMMDRCLEKFARFALLMG
jgi:hypothetical protein